MNFFKEQELARQRKRQLVFYFYLTVIATALSTSIALFYFGPYEDHILSGDKFYETYYFWIIFSIVFLYISLSSWLRLLQIGQGVESIAKMAGAVPVPTRSTDITHKRLTNIVEEMSLAAGIIPPRIYIMPNENDINAFAAGMSTHDAMIGVSQGCLMKLTREELQAVIAHEIGHIVSGDMKLNIELIGKLYGLMSIYDIGMTLMRSKKKSSYTSSSKKENQGSGLIIGLILAGIGLLGYLLALLLKLGISRGQEFNADAKSVQLTRNPQGLAGALKKIFAVKNSFRVNAPHKEQMNHLYFFYPESFFNFLSTHPPLEQRIKKIDPNFRPQQFKKSEITQFRNMLQGNMSSLIEASFSSETSSSSMIVLEDHQDYFDQTLAFFHFISGHDRGVPDGPQRYYHDRFKALTPEELVREMDVLIGRLKSIPESEIRDILKRAKEIILSDKLILPSETLCYTLFKEVLIPNYHPGLKRLGLTSTKTDIAMMMSYLASISSDSDESKLASFKLGMKEIYGHENFQFVAKISLSDLNKAFESARDLIPLGKQKVFQAFKMAINYDQSHHLNEAIFLKIISQIMGIPS